MAEGTDYFTLTVPFSSIPVRYSEPLSIETEMEYTLEEDKFPGLKDDQHILQPALMISKTQDCLTQNELLDFSEWSQTVKSNHGTGVPESTYQGTAHPQGQKLLPPTLAEAREELLAVLSDTATREKETRPHRLAPNPFDIMPALLSAISWDENGSNYPTHQEDSCQSRANGVQSRAQIIQDYHKKTLGPSAMAYDRPPSVSVQNGRHGCYGYETMQRSINSSNCYPNGSHLGDISRKRAQAEVEVINSGGSPVSRCAKRRKTNTRDHFMYTGSKSYIKFAETKRFHPELVINPTNFNFGNTGIIGY